MTALFRHWCKRRALQQCRGRQCDETHRSDVRPGTAPAVGQQQKRAIVAEPFVLGSSVSAASRRVDVAPGQTYRWRQERADVAAGFAEVVVSLAAFVCDDGGGCAGY
jgi:hypothetical protein